MKTFTYVLCIIAISQFVFFRWFRPKKENWSIGGVSIGDSREKVLRAKGSPSSAEPHALYYGPESELFIIAFDDDDIVDSVWGFTLECPKGQFSTKNKPQEVWRRMGPPDSETPTTSLYFHSDLVIHIDHAQGDEIGSFSIYRYADYVESQLPKPAISKKI